jgi:hypothetical protein
MRKTMNEIMTAPTAKTKMPTNSRNCEKTARKPIVKVFCALDVMPEPIWSLKSSRKSVAATQAVKLSRVKPV